MDGRALARTAAVTLDTDTITVPIERPGAHQHHHQPDHIGEPRAGRAAGHLHRHGDCRHRKAIPVGLVAFMAGPGLLGVSTLDSTGTATITTSALAVNLYRLAAYYIGVEGFESSNSPNIYELVGWSWPLSGEPKG